ncbi:MAG: hypothetical protein IJX17_03840 [Clostridia bacterium]|nr:hypothetical protein [Clostridia bacterium]
MENLEENLEDYIIDVSKIDFDEVRKVYDQIEKERMEREKSMTEEERENLRKIDEINNICDNIMEYRRQRDELLDSMTTEESIKYYEDICKRADEFANEVGMKSVTVDEIHNKK